MSVCKVTNCVKTGVSVGVCVSLCSGVEKCVGTGVVSADAITFEINYV